MFTEQQIRAARARVKTGADFPAEIQEFKDIGIVTYTFTVADGVITYTGERDFTLQTASEYVNHPYDSLRVRSQASLTTLQAAITMHQQGKTDFATFCVQAAICGVFSWTCDLKGMVCIYADSQGHEILRESIPSVHR